MPHAFKADSFQEVLIFKVIFYNVHLCFLMYSDQLSQRSARPIIIYCTTIVLENHAELERNRNV